MIVKKVTPVTKIIAIAAMVAGIASFYSLAFIIPLVATCMYVYELTGSIIAVVAALIVAHSVVMLLSMAVHDIVLKGFRKLYNFFLINYYGIELSSIEETRPTALDILRHG